MFSNRRLPPKTMVWTQNMQDWKQADQIEKLIPISSSLPPVPQSMLTTKSVSPQTIIPITEPKVVHRGIDRGAYFWLIVITGILSIMLSTVLGAEVSLIALIPALIIGGKRYRNIGYNPWLILLALIPIVNIAMADQCFACPSGYAQTKQSDRVMKTVNWIYIFLFILMVLAIVIPLLDI